jgi:hypothetical protein
MSILSQPTRDLQLGLKGNRAAKSRACGAGTTAKIGLYIPKPKGLLSRIVKACRSRYYSRLERKTRGSNRGRYCDDYARIICVVLEDHEGREEKRYARALFDTGCSKNLMSPRFKEKFTIDPEQGPGVAMETPGNGKFVSEYSVQARWAFEKVSSDYFRSDPRFMDAEFEVLKDLKTPERFDIVIGRDTINKESLLSFGRDSICLSGFRAERTTFTGMMPLIPCLET